MSPELKNQEPARLLAQTSEILAQEDLLRLGGGPEAIARQHEKGRKTARERIAILLDQARLCSSLVSGPVTRCTRSGAGRQPREC